MTVQSLYRRADRWTQGVLTRGHGNTKCYCLIGALEHKYDIDGNYSSRQYARYKAAKERVRKAINELFGYRSYSGVFHNIADFNDHPNTNIADVRAVVRRARV